MKRILLLSILIPYCGIAMEGIKTENPALAQQVKKQDVVAAGAEAKPVVASSSSKSADEKKGLLARCFVCCNGKAETK